MSRALYAMENILDDNFLKFDQFQEDIDLCFVEMSRFVSGHSNLTLFSNYSQVFYIFVVYFEIFVYQIIDKIFQTLISSMDSDQAIASQDSLTSMAFSMRGKPLSQMSAFQQEIFFTAYCKSLIIRSSRESGHQFLISSNLN